MEHEDNQKKYFKSKERESERKKNLVYKNQGRELIHQKCKENESMSRHNLKKK
jgi:hypothetical protein